MGTANYISFSTFGVNAVVKGLSIATIPGTILGIAAIGGAVYIGYKYISYRYGNNNNNNNDEDMSLGNRRGRSRYS